MSQALTSTFHEPFLRIWNLELWIPFERELLELCSVRITTSMDNPERAIIGPKDTTLKVEFATAKIHTGLMIVDTK